MKESLKDCCSFTDSVTSSAVLLPDTGLAGWWEGRCACTVQTMIADSFFSLHSFWPLIIVFNAKAKISPHLTCERILYEDKGTLSWLGHLCCWADPLQQHPYLKQSHKLFESAVISIEALYESFYILYETGQTVATPLTCAGNKTGILSATSCKLKIA